jgi:glycosyltransferase involved in cell wall biosynthesis
MPKILMIAFHYPPLCGSSGIHRTLSFSRYLPEYGWQPIILTAHPRAYPQIGTDRLHDIPRRVLVTRAFALDAARHLAIRGAHLRWLALPDRWVSWWLGAVPRGLRLLRQHRPAVIWSTYPIATAHLIGLTLHRLTGIPWVADFRDPMTERDPLTGIEYPLDPAIRRANAWIERPAVKYCARAVFTTPGTLRMYAERYPALSPSRWALIANGYDEEDFQAAERTLMPRASANKRIVLVHSGVLYPAARDPHAFFAALAALRQAGEISPSNLKVVLRASGDEEHYRRYLRGSGLEDIVVLAPSIPYHEALVEMLNADGLLIFQASNCNWQIPAKLYEYLRARRPIFAMTDPDGDTAVTLREAGVNAIVPLDSKEQIAHGLLDFIAKLRRGCTPVASDKEIRRHSRKSRTEELATLLDMLINSRQPGSLSLLS